MESKQDSQLHHQSVTPTPLSDSDDQNPPSTCPSTTGGDDRTVTVTAFPNQAEIFRAVEVVERDSLAIAQSFTSVFSSLRLALSEGTSCSVDHMQCFNDAAGRLQESVLDAATKGNRYINSCLRLNEEMRGVENLAAQLLNEEMKGVENLAAQLKILRRDVDALDSAVNKLLRLP